MRRKKITACILVAVLLIGALYIVQRLLVPKYQTGIVEGSMVEEYYKDTIRIGQITKFYLWAIVRFMRIFPP